jgi:regulator of sigma E protease
MTALIFIAVLFVLILVHEWGHFITAKRTGMRVDEFGIGFPPKLFGVKWGETEYTLNALPIGGFVRIFGEDPTQVDSEARTEVARAFSSRPRYAQALVLVAGVVMNIVLAWVLFAVAFMSGVPAAVEESEASAEAVLRVTGVTSAAPIAEELPSNAAITGVRAGGESLDVLTPSALQEFVTTHNDTSIMLAYELGDEQGTAVAKPQTGVIPDEPDRPALGVSSVLVETERYGIIQAVVQATAQTWDALVLIVTSIAGLLYQTFAGSADFSQVAGPVGIYNLVGDAAAIGFVSLLMFTAIISLNLAVINMFPFPALDGGRLLFVAIEACIRRPIDPIWTARLNLVGFLLLIALMLAVTYKDITGLL